MVSLSKIAAKTAGAALLAAKVYDAHTYGAMRADVYAQSGDAEAVARSYLNTQTLGAPDIIAVKSKDFGFRSEMGLTVRNFFNSVRGYLKGFGTMAVYNAAPMALGLGALLIKTKNKWVNGALAAASAIFIGATAVSALIGTDYKNSLERKNYQ